MSTNDTFLAIFLGSKISTVFPGDAVEVMPVLPIPSA